MANTLSASCLCGQIVFKIIDDFDYMGYCHCSECQKFSGSACAAFAGIKKSKVSIECGRDLIKHFEKYAGSRLGFCSHCGSCLYSEKTAWDITNIRLGILDDTPSMQANFHVYHGSKAPWHDNSDRLPTFDELPDEGFL